MQFVSRGARGRSWNSAPTNDSQIFEAVGHAPVGHPETMKIGARPAWRSRSSAATNDLQIFEAAASGIAHEGWR